MRPLQAFQEVQLVENRHSKRSWRKTEMKEVLEENVSGLKLCCEASTSKIKRKSCRVPERISDVQRKERQGGARFLGDFGTMSRDCDFLINKAFPCSDGINMSRQKKEIIQHGKTQRGHLSSMEDPLSWHSSIFWDRTDMEHRKWW